MGIFVLLEVMLLTEEELKFAGTITGEQFVMMILRARKPQWCASSLDTLLKVCQLTETHYQPLNPFNAFIIFVT